MMFIQVVKILLTFPPRWLKCEVFGKPIILSTTGSLEEQEDGGIKQNSKSGHQESRYEHQPPVLRQTHAGGQDDDHHRQSAGHDVALRQVLERIEDRVDVFPALPRR